MSDDGSKLWIDDILVVDNDGLHAPAAKEAEYCLATGSHAIRVHYFQGPRTEVALQLTVAPPDGDFETFPNAFELESLSDEPRSTMICGVCGCTGFGGFGLLILLLAVRTRREAREDPKVH